MAFNKDSTIGTITIVAALSLVCSIVVSVAAVGLRPIQLENRVIDKQRNILAVAGLDMSTIANKEISNIYRERIQARLVDLSTGQFVDADAENFDMRRAARDPATSIRLAAADDRAGLRQISQKMPVYFVKDSNDVIERIILPIHGQGLWSTMFAFVAVAPDGNTIKGITYYEHGETPGLGDQIENSAWRAQFVGRRLFDQEGIPALRIVKGHAAPGSYHEVDGLSGATLTANGVQHTFDFWMGSHGFGPFLARVKAGELNNE